jgi:hypothetical protein
MVLFGQKGNQFRGLEPRQSTCFMVFNHMAIVTFFRRPRLSVSYT